MTSASSIRNLMLAAAMAGVSSGLAAQINCYETSFGTSLGTGDDTLFGIQPIGFAFPFNGQTYTDVHVSTNGFLYLSNAGTPAPGSAVGSYSPTGATLVASVAPLIAPWWHDLNITAANGGGVYLNSLTSPNRLVITFDRAVEYGYSNLVTVQCQLYSTGQVVFFYSANTAIGSSNNCIVGFSPGGNVADPGAINISANPSTTVTTVYEMFHNVTLPFDIQGRATIFTPNAGGGYDVDTNTCVGATNTSYGAGCVFGASSFYQLFGSGTFDLGVAAPAVNSVLMTPTGGGGYLVTAGSTNWFTHTTPSLALTDDSQAPLTLPSAFTYPGGSTTTLTICSNGFIWLQPNVSNDYSPSVSELLGLTARLAPAWCDTVPDATNNVYAEYDAASNCAYITWDSVPTYTTPGSVRMQVVVNLSLNVVEYRYQDMVVPSSACITGWSMGGGAVDPSNRDISTAMPFLTVTDSAPLALAISGSPILGNSVTWTTSAIPATAVLSAQIISFGAVVPGFDLGVLGAPSCFQHVDPSIGSTLLLVGTPTATFAATIPNSPVWIGSHLYSQSVSLVPGVNALGLTSSNGIDSAVRAF